MNIRQRWEQIVPRKLSKKEAEELKKLMLTEGKKLAIKILDMNRKQNKKTHSAGL